MSHHGQKELSPAALKILEDDLQVQARALHLGTIGEFSDESIDETDEGDLAYAMATFLGRVIINYGEPVRWIAFTPEQALDLALQLRSLAKRARQETKHGR